MRRLFVTALALGLAACASAPKQADKGPTASPNATEAKAAAHKPGKKVSPYAPAQEDPSTRGDYVAGGLYKPSVADTTPDDIPDVDSIPEPDIVHEPRSRAGNRSSYAVLGKTYRVMDTAKGYVEEGMASYYGKKFHGRRTSNLEVYDMYAFTAAHKTLPLPSFVRVTNVANGKSVVVRVNDRGPFHAGRIIDLSYAAAIKLDVVKRGTARVEVRALLPGDDEAPVLARGEAKAPKAGEITLQVASFSARAHADRALERLRGAGIDGARVLDASADGQQVWRLRVGPLAASAVSELSTRIAGLGFGQPHRVTE